MKIYIYGYLNRVRSSRRLELECGRNIELIPTKVRDKLWLTGCQNPPTIRSVTFARSNRIVRRLKPHFGCSTKYSTTLNSSAKNSWLSTVRKCEPRTARKTTFPRIKYTNAWITTRPGSWNTSTNWIAPMPLPGAAKKRPDRAGKTPVFPIFFALWCTGAGVDTGAAPEFLIVAGRFVAPEAALRSRRA
ncbi:MAG: hypothetical protein IPH12_19250 [Saprospirales bacterium]|nr:hypothetical protein [Saprospirales bacterium]